MKRTLSLLLSIFSLLIIGYLILFDDNSEISRLLNYYDLAICSFFFFEFLNNLYNSKERLKYLMKDGWIDFISSIPSFEILRSFRLIKVIRLFRIFKSIRLIAQFKQSSLYELSLMAYTLVFLLFPVFILLVESDVGNIKTAEDTLWFTYVTITTVGYGDLYPVTNLGRILTGILMIFGVGLFGLVTNYISDTLRKNKIND